MQAGWIFPRICEGSNLGCANQEHPRGSWQAPRVPPHVPPAIKRAGRGWFPKKASPCSHRALPFNVHLAASIRLLAHLLLGESDVGIHQASSNTARDPGNSLGRSSAPGAATQLNPGKIQGHRDLLEASIPMEIPSFPPKLRCFV